MRLSAPRARSLDWAACSLGGLFVLFALARYTSTSRTVFARWSVGHVGLIVVCSAFVVTAGVAAWRASRSPAGNVHGLVGLAVLLWGASKFTSSLWDPDTGGRLIGDFVLLGSVVPAAIVLEYLALLAGACAALVATFGVVARARPSLQNIVLTIVALSLCLLLLEGVCRVMAIAAPETQGFPTKPTQIWSSRFVRLNSLGFRDREHAEVAAPGTRRILLVGDSITFGFGVKDPHDRFGDVLERLLNADGTGRVEVINAGVPDTHTLHHVDMLSRLTSYRPDYVALVHVFNDIEHASPRVRSVAADAPGFVSRVHPLRLAVLNSHLAEQIFVRVRKATYEFAGVAMTAADPYGSPEILAVHLAALERFADVARRAGAEVRLIPYEIRAEDDTARRRHDRFVAAVAARGIRVWSVMDAFAGHTFSDLRVNALDAHPNELANRLLAERLARLLRNESAGGAPSTAERVSRNHE